MQGNNQLSRTARRAIGVAAVFALAVFVGVWLISRAAPRGPGVLRIAFLDVGQGDASVIEGPTGRVVVVDGGGIPGTDEREGRDPGHRVVVPYLRSRGISRVDLIVPTHPDDDHVQGLVAVAERLHVDAALDGGYPGDSGGYRRLQEIFTHSRIPVYTARRGERIDLGGGARIEVLNPPDHALIGRHSKTNNNSVVLRIVYGRAHFVLTGDAETEAENEMLATVPDLSADVLKIGHHGSRWSTTPPFLARVHPAVGIISCGANNLYGHPHPEVLARLREIGARVFRTDQDGAVVVETDGNRLKFTTYRRAPQPGPPRHPPMASLLPRR